jgi:hypothetical protein
MSEPSTPTGSSDHSESSSERVSAAEALCALGSLSGEHTVELAQMTSGGEPIPEAPHITIWTDEPDAEDNSPLATGISSLITSTKDDDHSPFIVRVQAPHQQWFDYSDVSIPEGLEPDEDGDETQLWFGRFDTLHSSLETLVEAAEQLATVPRTS